MPYVVKDTFQYSGTQEFATLNDFVNYFWQGPPSDVITEIGSYLALHQNLKFNLLYTGIVDHTWNPETKVYTRTIDFGSANDYVACRAAVDYIREAINDGTLVVNDKIRQVMTTLMDIQKTTEILG